jgi:asparagine synthase (glutamine-hydrolysing)
MHIGYTGGIVRRGSWGLPTPAGWQRWHWAAERTEAFLVAGGAGCQLFGRHDVAVLLRGFVVDTSSRRPADLELLADRIVSVYREQGTLHLDGLEGCFTIGLIDGPAGRLLIHRNLIGDSHTYYHEVPDGVLLGSNLAELLSVSGQTPRANHDDLPAFFLNRMVPGRNTLLAGFHRLLPGEELEHREGQLNLVLRRTLEDLREGQPIRREALDRVEATVQQICADYHREAPEATNLLSGGVDSSFLQLHWNRIRPADAPSSHSYCVAVNHPRTQGDREYAETAAAALGTRHSIVPADGAYAEYLLDTLRTTGEMPSHVQLAYFLELGRVMAGQGVPAAVFGEGADSLFGTTLATALQSAALLRRLFPSRALRSGGAVVAGWLGWKQMRGYFHLADYLHDYQRLEHPVNRIAVFADWPAVEGCFGKEAVAHVAASRRELLDRYHVPQTPLERVHYAGVLGSSINIAALVTTLFARAGVRTFTPFYDSRMLRLVVNLSPRERFRFRRPKSLLKKSLARYGHPDLAHRSKKSFGQPIFEWMAPGGQLAPLVEKIDSYPFVDAAALGPMRQRPTWFLYNLLCYDLWHKMFIRRDPTLAASQSAYEAAIG